MALPGSEADVGASDRRQSGMFHHGRTPEIPRGRYRSDPEPLPLCTGPQGAYLTYPHLTWITV
ncbi:protein of unknown function (plasmid) [Caballeronia sp. S22]